MEARQAFEQGMKLPEYSKLDHGRLHNHCIEEFRTLCAQEIANTVDNPGAPATRADIALMLAGIYAYNTSFTMNNDAQRDAQAAAKAIETMGGTVYTGRFL